MNIVKVDKKSLLPIYHQIATQIKQYIEQNSLRDGDCIPSERELCEATGVSRMTVRQAVEILVDEGMLVREKGKGTFVSVPKQKQPLSVLTSFTVDALNRGKKPTSKIISCEVIPASESIIKRLELLPGSDVIKLERIRYSDDIPHAYECSYLNYEMAKQILSIEMTNKSLYQVLNQVCNLQLSRAREIIEASSCSREICQHLDIPAKSVTFQIKRITYNENNQPVEYVKSHYRIDKFSFEVELDL